MTRPHPTEAAITRLVWLIVVLAVLVGLGGWFVPPPADEARTPATWTVIVVDGWTCATVPNLRNARGEATP